MNYDEQVVRITSLIKCIALMWLINEGDRRDDVQLIITGHFMAVDRNFTACIIFYDCVPPGIDLQSTECTFLVRPRLFFLHFVPSD